MLPVEIDGNTKITRPMADGLVPAAYKKKKNMET